MIVEQHGRRAGKAVAQREVVRQQLKEGKQVFLASQGRVERIVSIIDETSIEHKDKKE